MNEPRTASNRAKDHLWAALTVVVVFGVSLGGGWGLGQLLAWAVR